MIKILYLLFSSFLYLLAAHEYTANNYKFLASVDPERCGPRLSEVQGIRATGASTVPSTISQELETNLFMLCREERTKGLLGVDTPEQAMKLLRESKNAFRG